MSDTYQPVASTSSASAPAKSNLVKLPKPRTKKCPYPNCDLAFAKAEVRISRSSFAESVELTSGLQHLRRHERTHNGQQPYACSRCFRLFNRIDSAVRHGKIHSQDAPPLPLLPGAAPGSVWSLVSDLLAAGAILPEAASKPAIKNAAAARPPPIPVAAPSSLPSPPASIDVGVPIAYGSDGLQLLADSVLSPIASGSGTNGGEDVVMEPAFDSNSMFGADDAAWTDELHRLLFEGAPLTASDVLNWPDPIAQPDPPPLNPDPQQPAPFVSNIISRPVPGATAESPAQALHQTRHYFNSLDTSLTPAWEVSSDFLDSALQLFMLRVSHLLPFLHVPTFTVRSTPPGLLLNCVALGSLFMGSEQARLQGEYIWKAIYRACLTSWDVVLREHGGKEHLVLTAATGQLYAMQSVNPQLNLTASLSHTLGLQWGRWAHIEADSDGIRLPLPNDPSALDAAWRRWARNETRLRAVLVHFILNSHVTTLHGAESTIRSFRNQYRLACSEDLWNASSAVEWAKVVERERAERDDETRRMTFKDIYVILFDDESGQEEVRLPALSDLSLYVLLEGIIAHAEGSHDDPFVGGGMHDAIGEPGMISLGRALLRWRAVFLASAAAKDDHLGLLMRWHAGYCAVLVKYVIDREWVNLIDRSIPAFAAALTPRATSTAGVSATPFTSRAPTPEPASRSSASTSIDFAAWSRTARARRALAHAAAIRTHAERTPFGREFPHAGMCIYAAAVIFQAFATGLSHSAPLPPLSGSFDLGTAADADWAAVGEAGLDMDDPLADMLAVDPLSQFIVRDPHQSGAGGLAPRSDGLLLSGSMSTFAFVSLLRHAGTVWGLSGVRGDIVASWRS